MIFLNRLVANHKTEKNLEHCPLLIHIAIWENVYMTWIYSKYWWLDIILFDGDKKGQLCLQCD